MQRMEMALDEERGAKMHQKHDTVCATSRGREEMENDGTHKDRHCSMLFLFSSLFPFNSIPVI